MLKILCSQTLDTTTLRLEGRLTGHWVDEFARLCREASPRRVLLDFSGLGYIDDRGLSVLGDLLRERVEIEQASALARELLRPFWEPPPSALQVRNSREAGRIARLKRGEAGAFEELVRIHGPKAFASARRLLGEVPAAERALEATFQLALESLRTLPDDGPIDPWLQGLAVRAAMLELNARAPRADSIDELLPAFEAHGSRAPDEADDWLALEGAGANLEGLGRELHASVIAAIDQLPDAWRAVLILCDVEGFGTSEAAQILGLRLPEARARLHHARQGLRTLIGRVLRSETRATCFEPSLSA